MKKLVIVLMILLVSSLYAGNTGIIKGKVTDKTSNDALFGANVLIEGTTIGAATNFYGDYLLRNIPAGTYTIVIRYIGYKEFKLEKVNVFSDSTVVINASLEVEAIEGEAVVVTSQAQGQANVASQMLMSSKSAAYHPGIIKYNTEEYSKINENTFHKTLDSPLSTFAADVDAASYSNARRFIDRNQLPPKDVVRTEEFINYFDYDYEIPKDKPLSINLEYSLCPWNSKHQLVHVGLQGEQLSKEEQKPSNLVFLLDVSGSMSAENKLPLLKKSFKLLVKQLSENDRVSIAVYAGSAGCVLPPTNGSEKSKIMSALDKLQAGGSTAGGAGIKLAYKMAKENFIDGGNNRVILATDGDFNVGISSTSELTRYIEEQKDEGIFLTVLGFGMGNYKDDRLQELADRGNGNHAYIDNILEAKKVLVNEITATLYTIAKDVKIQVEFNPAKVESYRLIGYENRMLEDKDFEDDTKDAGEIGSGHTVTALYEIIPRLESAADQKDFKYTETLIKDEAFDSGDLLTVRIRYKDPNEVKSKEIVKVLTEEFKNINKTSNNFRFSAAVAEFAMILRDSEFKNAASIESVMELAKSAKGKDDFGYRSNFINLVEKTEILLDEDLSSNDENGARIKQFD